MKPRSLSCLKNSGSNYAMPFCTLVSGPRWLTCLRSSINTEVESEAQSKKQHSKWGWDCHRLPVSHALFNGLGATSVPCTDECSGWFPVHFANWVGYCSDAASWRTGTNAEPRYAGSDPIFTFTGVNQKLLFTTQWKLRQCESDTREKNEFVQRSSHKPTEATILS